MKELIVIAQDITRYGIDLYHKRMLGELLTELCKLPFHWIRLHYLYPDDLDDALIDVIAREPKVLNYIDIPLQHINDGILKRMCRRSTKAEILALLAKLRDRLPGLVLRTSLICGLPGEGKAEFEELCEFLREARIERAGIFQFSPEEGTPAAEMEDQVDAATAERRVELVVELQSRVMDAFNEERWASAWRCCARALMPRWAAMWAAPMPTPPTWTARCTSPPAAWCPPGRSSGCASPAPATGISPAR